MSIAKLQRLRRSWAVVTWTICLGCASQRFQSTLESEDSSHESPDASSSNDGSSSVRPTTTSVVPGPDVRSTDHSSGSTSSAASPSDEVTSESDMDDTDATSEDASGDGIGATTAPSASSDVTRSEDVQTTGSDACANDRSTCTCAPAPREQCESVTAALLHRFSFEFAADETPSRVRDSVGDVEATLTNPSLNEQGVLQLDGKNAYVQLPPKFVSRHEELTLDIWTEWFGGATSQRLLNFGRAPKGPANPDNYLAVSPSDSRNVLSVQFRTSPMRSGDRLDLDFPLPTNSLQHLTLVIRREELQLYVNGELAGTLETVHRLTSLDDAQVWLGRPLYDDHPFYEGTLHEFRVFGRALSADEIRYAHALGLYLPRE